ncbi:MAG: PilZ domain-containing protein [Nitrospiraceae bacterium]|nr:MAG: PilZ domain-containing protein [Nitrospiraceae bacterium]
MPNDKRQEHEKRDYFRVDDVIAVVANPVHLMNEKEREAMKSAVSSKAFSLFDTGESVEDSGTESYSEPPDSGKLYDMMNEIRAKLDFLINHLLLEKEGLVSTEKKHVNISASGIRFTVKHPVKEKDILEIKLLLPTYPPVAVFAYGEVKRVRALDDQTYDVAIEYLNMGESARNEIIQYTLNHQRETIRKMKESG